MAIAIPAIVDTLITNLRAELEPHVTAATNTASSPRPPYVNANRVADIMALLSGLITSGTLTGVGIHTAADATNNIAVAPAATDLATAQTLLNAMRDGTGEAGGGMAAHFLIVGASEHIGADVTNAITAAAATDLATAATLANDLKTQFNGHLALNAATGHYGPDLANVVRTANATAVLAEVIALANDLRASYNAHVADINAGSVRHVVDNAAFTGVNSLIGSTITFDAATTTVALRGVTATVLVNGVNHLEFNADLPATPVVGDEFVLTFGGVDTNIDALRQGKGTGDSASNPYGPGPQLADAAIKMLTQMGATLPDYLTGATGIANAEPFGLLSPHGGGNGVYGHGGATLMGDLVQRVRDAVAAYTVPA